MSEILEDMAQELELYEKYDFALGEQLSTMLRASGVLPIDVNCRVDRYNRLSVEIEAAKEEAAALFKKDLLRQIDRVYECSISTTTSLEVLLRTAGCSGV